MPRFWFWFRIALLTVCVGGLGAYLLSSTPWRQWVGLQPDYATEIAEGDRIVAAIYRFKEARGLWPEYLEDLAPDYLPAPPERDWFYDISPADERGQALPTLSRVATREGLARRHLGYDFDPKEPAWRVFGEVNNRVVRGGAPAGTSTADIWQPLIGPRAVRALAELDRRLAREPGILDHWRDKAALLVGLGRTKEAITVAEAAEDRFPESAWPRLALAALANDASRSETLDDLRHAGMMVEIYRYWVEHHSSMTRWYGVWWLERQLERDQAEAAIQEALKQPVEVDTDDRNVAAYYLWDMARWALRQEKWELVIAITTDWEKAQAEGKTREDSYLALRAAARLAMGDIALAKQDADAAGHAKATWARGIEALKTAIENGDRAYRYAPGNEPGELKLFVQPE